MSYCVNPKCLKPQNPDTAQYCQSCGSQLVLQNRYCPIQPLGEGGFGRTYLAVDQQIPSQPPCVIKQFHFQPPNTESYQKAAKLFRQEAVRLDQLGKHPQIPQILAHFEQNKQLFLVQEYIAGKTLDQELQKSGVFSEYKILELLRGLLPVLQFIHQYQIIHRDIKPANIIRRSLTSAPPKAPQPLERESDQKKKIQTESQRRLPLPPPPLSSQRHSTEKQIILIDFGVAKLLTSKTVNRTGTVIGSPQFMAPEQYRGKAFPASDLYSLGVTCLYLMTRISPNEMYDLLKEEWKWRNFLPDKNRVSSQLGQILDRLVEPKINQRYPTAEQVLKEMNSPSKPVVTITPSTPSPIASESLPSQPTLLSQPLQVLGRWIPALAQPTEDDLTSAVGVDYTKLQHLLACHRWKAADTETWGVLCQALSQPRKRYLHPRDLTRLPCPDLCTLDRLWLKYSQGRFGLSIQARIYESVEGDYGQFCDRIGWLTYNPHDPSVGLKYSHSAPIGHLPSRIWVISSGQWWQHIQIVSERLAECEVI